MRDLINKISKTDLVLKKNRKQIKDIKKDYINSQKRRRDLDHYLENEEKYVNQMSANITEITELNTNINEKFDSLNKVIELVIYEN